MNIASVRMCTPTGNNNKNNNPAFGSVIPVSILYHDIITKEPKCIIMQKSIEARQRFFHDIMQKLNYGIGRRTEVGRKIASKLRRIDPEFRNTHTIRTIRNGKYVEVHGKLRPVVEERYLATGGDASHIIESGNNNFRRCEDKQDAKIALIKTESGLCKDLTNRIKGVKSFIISVVPRFVNKGKPNQRIVYDIKDGYFLLKRGQYQSLTGQKPPQPNEMNEFQKKLIELFKNAK